MNLVGFFPTQRRSNTVNGPTNDRKKPEVQKTAQLETLTEALPRREGVGVGRETRDRFYWKFWRLR